ncbi:MAG: hypothetical protein ACUVRY_03550 [Thermoanaerobaculaceae bacterium]
MDRVALAQFRETVSRVRQGPHPTGEEFELCREVIAAAPESPEAANALRLLLEGAMADAGLSIADAQVVMQILKFLDKGILSPRELLLDFGGQ